MCAFVKRLKVDLEAAGFGVWLDTDDIPAGSDWHGAIGNTCNKISSLFEYLDQNLWCITWSSCLLDVSTPFCEAFIVLDTLTTQEILK